MKERERERKITRARSITIEHDTYTRFNMLGAAPLPLPQTPFPCLCALTLQPPVYISSDQQKTEAPIQRSKKREVV